MSEYDEYHEVERVSLRGATAHSRLALHAFSLKHGYSFNDDFHYYFLDRAAIAENHEAITAAEFSVLRSGGQVEEYEDVFVETDGVWDSLEASYLLASLPQSCIARFVQDCEMFASEFGLSMYRGLRLVSAKELQADLDGIAVELSNTHGDPGSKWLAITIEGTYPRRPKA